MKMITSKVLLAAVCLIVVGLIIFAVAMSILGWDFSALDSSRFETSVYDINGPVQDILIVSDTDRITFVATDDGTARVELFEREKLKHRVFNEAGALKVELEDTRKWYDHIGLFQFKTPRITVYLPRGEYASLSIQTSTGDVSLPAGFSFKSADISLSTGDVFCGASCEGTLNIKTSTGDIDANSLSAGELSLKVSTGRVFVTQVSCLGSINVKVSTGKAALTDVSCESFTSSGSTGDITLTNVVASVEMNIQRSTGDVKLEKCDAAELVIKTGTGDVTGSLLSEKVFIAKSGTGSVKVPETVSGGKCSVTTDTGRIRLTVE
ncbi:MAG: DUF4097 domain-containing protein [Clostridiales bacterium]|nr:DUF4097 domain-containing protein [Clostridiales bacterium]